MYRIAIVALCIAASPMVNYGQINITAGLVGYWNLDEGSGSAVADASGHANNGNINGASWIDGIAGSALSFDGQNDWISVQHSISLQPTTGISVCVWVRPSGFYTGSCQGNYVVSKGSDGLPGWYGLDYGDGSDGNCSVFSPSQERFYFSIRFADNSVWSAVTNTVVQIDELHFIAGTYDGTQISIFDNGTLASSTVVTENLGTNTSPLTIGMHDWPYFPYWVNGLMDEIRIYDRALSAEEVQFLYEYPGGNSGLTVTNVFAAQVEYPSRIVRIHYDLWQSNSLPCTVSMQISSDGGVTWAVPVIDVHGAVGTGIAPGNAKIVQWNAGFDWPDDISESIKVRVIADDTQ